MLRVSPLNKNGLCDVVITYDFETAVKGSIDGARNELTTYLINYCFVKDYWKLYPENSSGRELLNLGWTITRQSFIEEIQYKPGKNESFINQFNTLELGSKILNMSKEDNVNF